MFRPVLLLNVLAFALLLPIASARADQPTTGKTKTVRLLTVGNSFSQNATRYLNDLVKAQGHTLIHRPLAIGGASMEVHWDKAQLHEKDPKEERESLPDAHRSRRAVQQERLQPRLDASLLRVGS